jgi:hypothetical protein
MVIIENRAGLKEMEYSGMKCMPLLKLFNLSEMDIRKDTQYCLQKHVNRYI